MSNTNPLARKLPDPDDGAVGSAESFLVSPDLLNVLLDWRARRLDDDPNTTAEWMIRLEDLIATLAPGHRPRGILDDPEDASQEAWVILLMRLPGLCPRAGADLRAWLAVVVRNRLANLRRAEAGRRESPLSSEAAALLVGREEDPAEAFARDRIIGAVRSALEEARRCLSEASYRVVLLKWIEGRTTAEIAGALGISTAQVSDRDRRALVVLGRLLRRRIRTELIGLFGEEFDLPEDREEVA